MSRSRVPAAALRALAGHQLRRSVVASVVLALAAGLLAAVPLSLLSASIYGRMALDRFLTWSDTPDLLVNVCPEGFDPVVDGFEPCVTGVDLDEPVRRIAGLDGVRDAFVGGYLVGQGGVGPDPDTVGPPLSGFATTGSSPTASGRPLVVRGRVAGAGAPDEIMVTEYGAERYGIDVGDELHLGSPGSDHRVRSTVVGVVRTAEGLVPVNDATSASIHVRAPWLAAHGGQVRTFEAVVVQMDHGRVGDAEATLRAAFPDRFVSVEQYFAGDQRRIVQQSLDFESTALVVVAALSATAGAGLIAQLVARRSRAELAQWDPLRALGATDGLLAGSVVLRWLPVAAGAVVVAVTAVALSPLVGPFGVARRAPWSSAPRLDWTAATAAMVLPLCVLGPALVAVRRRSVVSQGATPGVGGGVTALVASVFLRQSLGRRSVGSMVTALVASSAALACSIGAATVASSLDRVVEEPERFGAPYDALIPASFGPPTDLADLRGVEGATVFRGTHATVGEDTVWVQALSRFEELSPVPPVIFEGRAPATVAEVALAPVTMAEVGRSIGDTIEITGPLDDRHEYRIVGTAPITDGYEHNVGLGGLLTEEGLARLDPTTSSNPGDIAVRVDPLQRDEVVAEVRAAYPEAFVPFPVPATLRNAKRISGLPVVLAFGGAAVAAATFVHALLVTVRQRRRDLAILRVLGFVRRQSFAVVIAVAAAVGVVSAAAGAFAGAVAGVWGWQALSDAFGVDPSPLVAGVVLVAAPLALVAVAVASAIGPARRAARVRPARVLRADRG